MKVHLVIQTAFLGDLLLSIPLLKRIKKDFPSQPLFLVCRQGFGDFFLKLGLVDRCFEIKKGDKKTYQKIQSELSQFDIDCLISPHESLRTAFFVRGLKASHKWSYRHWWSFFFYSKTIVKNAALPDALKQLSLLSLGGNDIQKQILEYSQRVQPLVPDSEGVLPEPPSWGTMNCRAELEALAIQLWPSLEERFEFLKKMDSQKFALVFPGSVWATKRWTTEGFVKAAQGLQNQGYEILLMGGPGEESLATEVGEHLSGVYNLTGKTKVIESALILLKAHVVLANDSASAHLAAVAETPCAAVFGPTVLRFGYRPWGSKVFIAENKNLKCRPCGKHGHKKCPIGTHECMKSVSASEVLAGIEAVTRKEQRSRQ